MSTASTSRTIKFISKAGTYTAVIMSPSGDVYQEYEGTQDDVLSAPQVVSPKVLWTLILWSIILTEKR